MLGAISEFQASDAAAAAAAAAAPTGVNLGGSTRLGRDEQSTTPMRYRASGRSSAARSLAASIRRTPVPVQPNEAGTQTQDAMATSPSSSPWHRAESSTMF